MSGLGLGADGKKYASVSDYDAQTILGPATRIALLPSDGSTFSAPKFIIADKAGTATITDLSGTATVGFPLTGGEQRLMITNLSALATSTKVWGGY